MKSISKNLVYSNLWVGLAVGSLSFISMIDQVQINLSFLAFVTCSTVFAYNYMRLVQMSAFDLRHNFSFKAWIVGHRRQVWILSLMFGIFSFYFFLGIYQLQLLYLLIPAFFISLLYPLSFKNAFSGFTSLRTAPGLKMFLIALTWSYVTVIIPSSLYGTLRTEVLVEFVMRTVLILGLVVPFDIRDVDYDDPEMKTIPQVLGTSQARQLAQFFLTVYQFWIVIRFFVFQASLVFTLALFIGLEIGYWLIRYADKKRGEGYYSFWIEGIPIFTAVLIILAWWLSGDSFHVHSFPL